eukprot:GHUV01056520.1.p1 GENE.GHUV01056520.1~~GHUV01056520.1.p1  ORF type:complete len:104 (+),score=10.69 GHUV01056520.1:37-312(+)
MTQLLFSACRGWKFPPSRTVLAATPLFRAAVWPPPTQLPHQLRATDLKPFWCASSVPGTFLPLPPSVGRTHRSGNRNTRCRMPTADTRAQQ